MSSEAEEDENYNEVWDDFLRPLFYVFESVTKSWMTNLEFLAAWRALTDNALPWFAASATQMSAVVDEMETAGFAQRRFNARFDYEWRLTSKARRLCVETGGEFLPL